MQSLKALIKTMRPHQWLKNVLIFTGLVFDGQLGNVPALVRTSIGFLLFCLISSTVYIINDIADVEADRQHPTKRNRPIASGVLSVSGARVAAVVLVVLSFPVAYLLSRVSLCFVGVLPAYLGYSKWLKHIPIIDVFVLASFYVLRVVAGLTIIHVARFSPWLYVVTSLLALYIGLGKRRAELALLAGDAYSHRKVLMGIPFHFLDNSSRLFCSHNWGLQPVHFLGYQSTGKPCHDVNHSLRDLWHFSVSLFSTD